MRDEYMIIRGTGGEYAIWQDSTEKRLIFVQEGSHNPPAIFTQSDARKKAIELRARITRVNIKSRVETF